MDLSPKQIVNELDKYIIGQSDAKKAVAIALRNRYRRSKLSKEMRDEITPKNIIMQGPTGVGKTEIARRLAKLVKAPFIKVEATKFTEVGYVGRDCESMIRDLVEYSVRLVKEEKVNEVKSKAKVIVESKLLDAIIPVKKDEYPDLDQAKLKEKLLEELECGKLDNEVIEISVSEQAKPIGIMPGMGPDMDLGNVLGSIFPPQRKKKKMTVAKAYESLLAEESDKLIDDDSVNSEAIRRAEQDGIIFIDEIDKIAGKGSTNRGPDVSREGVQRDILPLVEGSTVTTKYGTIKTDYILFIAAGAFHISRVEDLIPEFQGRFPIRVELNNLNAEDFYNILTQPKNALTLQYQEMLKVDNINLTFTEDALKQVAYLAEKENETSENLGARRLHNIMEKLLEDISYNANGEHQLIDITIDKKYVDKTFAETTKKYDLTKYII
ncbi:MAG: ATP-dependent protease ATPase subunit HslU [Firmicutes bacterium]|nr:ATP-dependent protease ATPase subunit HslU [Bacillota bacterium]MDY5676916.1 ATP-dependent protease ATPase subunit HslU [Eubacteriales bacterium]